MDIYNSDPKMGTLPVLWSEKRMNVQHFDQKMGIFRSVVSKSVLIY